MSAGAEADPATWHVLTFPSGMVDTASAGPILIVSSGTTISVADVSAGGEIESPQALILRITPVPGASTGRIEYASFKAEPVLNGRAKTFAGQAIESGDEIEFHAGNESYALRWTAPGPYTRVYGRLAYKQFAKTDAGQDGFRTPDQLQHIPQHLQHIRAYKDVRAICPTFDPPLLLTRQVRSAEVLRHSRIRPIGQFSILCGDEIGGERVSGRSSGNAGLSHEPYKDESAACKPSGVYGQQHRYHACRDQGDGDRRPGQFTPCRQEPCARRRLSRGHAFTLAGRETAIPAGRYIPTHQYGERQHRQTDRFHGLDDGSSAASNRPPPGGDQANDDSTAKTANGVGADIRNVVK